MQQLRVRKLPCEFSGAAFVCTSPVKRYVQLHKYVEFSFMTYTYCRSSKRCSSRAVSGITTHWVLCHRNDSALTTPWRPLQRASPCVTFSRGQENIGLEKHVLQVRNGHVDRRKPRRKPAPDTVFYAAHMRRGLPPIHTSASPTV